MAFRLSPTTVGRREARGDVTCSPKTLVRQMTVWPTDFKQTTLLSIFKAGRLGSVLAPQRILQQSEKDK